MRTISKDELKEILEKHRKWLYKEEGGEQADLSHADLSHADLQNADLSAAKLQNADLSCANLSYANLNYADLQNAVLQDANLQDVNFYIINLKDAKRTWLITVGNIGSRQTETVYFVDYDNIRCGCWNNFKGGTLSEFRERINEVYPADNIATNKYRIEYLSAIDMFANIRQLYLNSKNKI
jgi:uncharacterized protein YjbI with pentapeptide repeats